MENTNNKTEKVFCGVLVFIAVLLPFVLIQFHEQWRDEAQAWLLVRDNSLSGLFDMLKYEGHPALWYLILMPFAKLGFPYECVNYISWAASSLGIALFLLKAPFGKAVKTITAISPIFIYWLPVVSRSYALVPPLTFALAWVYRDRKEKAVAYGILIALLVNVHILTAGFCGALLLNELIDIIVDTVKKRPVSKKRYAGFAAGFIGCLVMVIQMWGCMEKNGVVKMDEGAAQTILRIWENALIFETHLFGFMDVGLNVFMMLMFLLFMLMLMIMLVKYYRQFIVFACGIGFNLVISLLLYRPYGQKSHLIIIMLLFIAWTLKTDTSDGLKRAEDDKKAAEKTDKTKEKKDIRLSTAFNFVTCLMLIVNMPNAYREPVLYDVLYNFSASRDVAEFLDANADENSVVIPLDDMLGASIAAHTKKARFWNMYNNTYSNYAILNVQRAYAMYDYVVYANETEKAVINGKETEGYKNSVRDYMQKYISEHFEKGTKVYFAVCRIYYPRFDAEMESVFESEQFSYYSFSEGYKVYVLTA